MDVLKFNRGDFEYILSVTTRFQSYFDRSLPGEGIYILSPFHIKSIAIEYRG